jgi:hypothetical protein
MTTAQLLLQDMDGIILLSAVWLVNGLLVIFLYWWNKRFSLACSLPWWSPANRESTTSDKRYNLILTIMIAVAIALRCYKLNSDLWIDEVLSLVHFVRLDLSELLTYFGSDNHHILYSALAHISVNLFGESAAAYRLPAVLFGVLSIWASAHLVRYVFGKKEALLTAALLTLSYHHVWFSQNARAYTLLLFATVVSTELLLRGLASGRNRYWLAYAAVIAMAAWAHLTTVIIAIAHGMVLFFLGLNYLFTSPTKSWQWQPFLALALAGWLTINIYAPVMPELYQYFNRPGAGSTTGSVAWSKPIWLVSEILHNLGLGLTLGWFSVATVGALGLIGLFCVFKRDWLFPLLALAPVLVSGAILYLLGRSLWPRMFFPEIGFLAAIVAIGVWDAGQLLGRIIRPWPRLVQIVPALLLCILLSVTLPKVYQYPKQDFSGARDYVKANLRPGDNVLGIHMAGRVYHQYYEPGWPEIRTLEQLDEQRADSGYTWVIHTLPGYIKSARPGIQHKLDTEFEVMRKFPGTLGDGVIIVLRSKKRGSVDE